VPPSFRVGAHRGGDLGNLLSRRAAGTRAAADQEADGHRPAGHDLEQFDKVGLLHGQKLGNRRAARLLVVGEDHFAHRLNAPLLEEHVLGAAKPDALGAETNGGLRIGRRVGVGAYAKPAYLVRPANQGREFTG
jgi:hypothetical protein